ncbi:MAG: LamG domain-containing protein [Kiritimatiellae bacterium]|nr:LamG domain-containing protein [Kiritimatiellia bacterium]
MGDFSFDEVRVSRGALRPYQFLTSKAVEEDLLARASFEDNLVMTPYTNFFGAAGTASAFVAGAAKPKCVRTRPARVLTAGPKGEVVTDANRYSLEFNGGKVVYPGRALVADTDEFTLEFFIKTDDARPGAGIMRVNRESASAIANEVMWALSFADTDGNLLLKLDTDTEEGQTHEFAAALADDKWHHVGVQFARSAGNTEVKVYRDYELAGTWTAEGRLLTRPRELNFMIGAGEDTAAGFVGLVDELRITPGIVPHTEFLTPRRKISTIVVR